MRSFAKFPALCLSVLLAGCGYHLRGAVDLPESARAVYLEGIGYNQPFSIELAERMSFAGGVLTRDKAQAGSVIHILKADQDRRQVSLSRAGRANAFDLIYRIEYEVTSPGGEVRLPRQEIEVRREYFNDQRFPLGQLEEENLMRSEMQREVAQALLRRVFYALKNLPGKT